jgi:hypothetical protein
MSENQTITREELEKELDDFLRYNKLIPTAIPNYYIAARVEQWKNGKRFVMRHYRNGRFIMWWKLGKENKWLKQLKEENKI